MSRRFSRESGESRSEHLKEVGEKFVKKSNEFRVAKLMNLFEGEFDAEELRKYLNDEYDADKKLLTANFNFF